MFHGYPKEEKVVVVVVVVVIALNICTRCSFSL